MKQSKQEQIREAYEKSSALLDEIIPRFKALPSDQLNSFDCIEFWGAAVRLECAVKEVEQRLSETREK